MEYTIGKAAEAVGVSAHTIRYYEKEGLLPPVRRNDKGIRVFDDEDMTWIDFVRCLRETGMSIGDIKEFIKLATEEEDTEVERIKILSDHKAKVKEKIKELESNLEKISVKIDWYSSKESNH